MERQNFLDDDPDLKDLFLKFKKLYEKLGGAFLKELDRLPSLPDVFVDRWERAKMLGFGERTNIYDNSLVIGEVQVGRDCWIGPNTVLDGSGELTIGNNCTISAGVQIYTHDNVKETLSSKVLPIERKPTRIGDNVYIGPQSVITKGIQIGNNVVIGAFSFVNKDVADNSIVIGQPATRVGDVERGLDGSIVFKYHESR